MKPVKQEMFIYIYGYSHARIHTDIAKYKINWLSRKPHHASCWSRNIATATKPHTASQTPVP